MIQLVQRLLALGWRHSGATLHEADIAGCRVWYADFPALRAPVTARPGGRRPARALSGRAPTLLLLHGLGASSTSFYPVIPHLRRGYRVVVPDLPGYGFSRAPRGREFVPFSEIVDVAEKLLARVAPRGGYVAGNSMGGWIAAKLAARRPDLVRAMALLNPGGPALRADDWVDFARILLAEERGAVDEWLRRTFHRAPPAMRLLRHDLGRLMRRPAVTQLMANLQSHDFLSPEEAARVRSPAVLVWGERDRLIPDGCRAFYLRQLGDVRYAPVPDCGHCPQLECPERTAEILLQLPSYPASRHAAPRRRRPRPALPAAAGGLVRGRPAPERRGVDAAVARAPRG
jgi:abhydrolase domain-containing protein 6